MNFISPKASILAIGTELTTGQITNRNAATLSARLVDLGFQLPLHETVADDRAAIEAALDRCASVSDLLVITGGLGPTSDDFTREVIAKWADTPLEFHENSWKHIENRLNRLGIPVAQSNRQQCDYPQGAEILENPQGTAHAFRLTVRGKHLLVLPGPPLEIAAIWENAQLDQDLCARFAGLQIQKLFTWECLGQSEAALGEITEKTLAGSLFQTGYRAHRPFVEIKVWVPESRLLEAKPWLDRLEKALSPWIFSQGDQNFSRSLLRGLACQKNLRIIDYGTAGLLSERLAGELRSPEIGKLKYTVTLTTEWNPKIPFDVETHTSSVEPSVDETLLILGPISSNGSWSISYPVGTQRSQTQLHAPWKSTELADRIRRFAVEVSIKKWFELLGCTH